MSIAKLLHSMLEELALKSLLAKLTLLAAITALSTSLMTLAVVTYGTWSAGSLLALSVAAGLLLMVLHAGVTYLLLKPLRQVSEELRRQAGAVDEGRRLDDAGHLALMLDRLTDGLQHQIAEQIFEAETDALTGLLNRRGFDRRRQDLSDASLIFIDLDNFKTVNDTLGHSAGDALLRQTADLLRSVLRDGELVARFGGDEFVILLPHASLEQARRVAERVRVAAAKNLKIEHLTVTLSVGVAQTDANTDIETALISADLACYAGKRSGRNKVLCSDRHASAVLEPMAAE